MAVTTRYPEPLVFGLDIGTRSIVGTVGYKEKNKFNVVAMAVKFHDTRSMIDGQIHDISRVSEDIVYVKEELEKQLGNRKLKEVCIAAAGRVLKTAIGHGEYDFPENTVITQEYIHSIDLVGVEKAHDLILQEISALEDNTKYYCVGYTVIRYFLNGFEIHNLEGHKGTKIGADVLATFLPEEVVSSLYTAVTMAGLEVTNLTLEPIAAINVAIPEEYRLLNIALIDVGAGTSDICITRDGSIVAYGMIPSAGDELTEVLVKKYLIDFNTAEKLKTAGNRRKNIIYKDIMGISHKISPEEILNTIDDVKKKITAKIAEKIIELNGNATVSAAFVVGGGGKLTGFTEYLAGALNIPAERVALRGQEVMGNIEFLVEGIKKDSLYVTPVGICLNYFDQKNNFIFVTVNGERIKLYNNDRLTVFDAAIQYGLSNEDIFPKRGADITFKINGKSRIVRGYPGEAAIISQNGLPVGLNATIEANDHIQIEKSTRGGAAYAELGGLPEFNGTLSFTVNGKKIVCPRFAIVNKKPQGQLYKIADGDEICMQDYYTLSQLLTFMDVNPEGKIYINNKEAALEDRIYDNFAVEWKDVPVYSDLKDNDIEPEKQETDSDSSGNTAITVMINGKPVVLSGKNDYIFVDIFDFYDFDLSAMHGKSLVTNINGNHAEYVAPIQDGSIIDLYWEK